MSSQIERELQEEDESVDLRYLLTYLLTILFKHQLTIVTVFIFTVFTVVLVTFLAAPTYEASSSLLVKLGRDYTYMPKLESGSMKDLISQEEVINSEIEILHSQDLIEKVINTLGIENIYPAIVEDPPTDMTTLDAAVINFKKNLGIEGIKKSNVIVVSFQNKYPDITAKTVNLLIELYREKHLKMFSETNSSFLENAVINYEQKLKQSETSIETFKQEHRVYSLDEQRSLLLKQRTELDTALKDSRAQINELQQRLSSLQNQAKVIITDKALYTLTSRDNIVVEARAKLLALQIEEKELLMKYKADNPLVVKIRSELDLVTRFLKEQELEIMSKVKSGNIVYQEAEKQIIVTQANLSAQQGKAFILEQQVRLADNELRDLDLQEKELTSLKRDRDANEKNYKTYLEKFEEAKLDDEMNRQKMANVTVINPADIPAKPIKPKKALNIIIGIILGMVSGLGFAFLREYMSQGISTPTQAEERLGLKILADVPYNKGYQ